MPPRPNGKGSLPTAQRATCVNSQCASSDAMRCIFVRLHCLAQQRKQMFPTKSAHIYRCHSVHEVGRQASTARAAQVCSGCRYARVQAQRAWKQRCLLAACSGSASRSAYVTVWLEYCLQRTMECKTSWPRTLAHLHLLLCQPPPVAPLCLQAVKAPQGGHRLCSASRQGPRVCPRTGARLSLYDVCLGLSLPAADCEARLQLAGSLMKDRWAG